MLRADFRFVARRVTAPPGSQGVCDHYGFAFLRGTDRATHWRKFRARSCYFKRSRPAIPSSRSKQSQTSTGRIRSYQSLHSVRRLIGTSEELEKPARVLAARWL